MLEEDAQYWVYALLDALDWIFFLLIAAYRTGSACPGLSLRCGWTPWTVPILLIDASDWACSLGWVYA